MKKNKDTKDKYQESNTEKSQMVKHTGNEDKNKYLKAKFEKKDLCIRKKPSSTVCLCVGFASSRMILILPCVGLYPNSELSAYLIQVNYSLTRIFRKTS